MSQELLQLFAGLDTASVDGKLPKLDEGVYRLVVVENDAIDSHETQGKTYLISCEVVECYTPGIAAKYPKGKAISITVNRLQSGKEYERKMALGNVKGYLAAVCSHKMGRYISPESNEDWIQMAALSCVKKDLFKGCEFLVQIDRIDTERSKKSGNPNDMFSKPTYRAINAPV